MNPDFHEDTGEKQDPDAGQISQGNRHEQDDRCLDQQQNRNDMHLPENRQQDGQNE